MKRENWYASEGNPMTNTREERVAAIIAPHLRVSVGPNPDCDTQNEAHEHALRVARQVIAVEPSPDVWELLKRTGEHLQSWVELHPMDATTETHSLIHLISALPDPPKATVEEDRA